MDGFYCFIFLSLYPISLVLADDIVVKDESHFPTAWATKISPLCYSDSQSYFQSYQNAEKWASKMYKATGFLSIEGLKNMYSFAPSAGLFDLCLSVESPSFQGQYCSAFFKFEPIEGIDSSNKSTSKGAQEQNGDIKTFRLPRVGFCIPSSCSASDFRSSVVQLVNRKINTGNQTNVITVVTDENYCYTKNQIYNTATKFDGPEIAMIVTLGCLGILILSATLYDIYQRWYFNNNNQSTDCIYLKKMLHCFSAMENGRKILSTKTISSDLSCLHGIRVLSATWIVLFHTFNMSTNQQRSNALGPERNIPIDFTSQALTRGTIAVDTFFLISGLLVSYNFIREMKRNNGNFNLLSFYFHRYIRIAPFYMFYLGFLATLLFHLGTGPMWTSDVQKANESCRSDWWTHFLFIRNYFVKTKCMNQAWYLAVDMQLFVLSPLFVYPLWRWKRVGLAWTLFALTALIVATVTIFIVWSLPVTYLYAERPIETKKTQFPNYYCETWPRLPQYLAGILLGWLICKKRKISVSWIGLSFGWILSMTTILLVLYGMLPFLDEELVPELNPFVRVSYGAFSCLGWAIAVGWIIFACLNGYGGFVNTFLSWKGFIPLGRLTFIVYLIHYDLVFVYFIGYSRAPIYYTRMDLMLNYLLVVVVSFVLAFFLSISIEMPFINLDRILRSCLEDRKKLNQHPTEELNEMTKQHQQRCDSLLE